MAEVNLNVSIDFLAKTQEGTKKNESLNVSSENSVFAKFNDKDNIIDSSDVEYTKVGVISQKIDNFFKEFLGKTQEWTESLKQRIMTLIEDFNLSLSGRVMDTDFQEIEDRKLRPQSVIYNEKGAVVQKICFDMNGDEVVILYDDNEKIKQINEKESGTITNFEYDGNGNLSKEVDNKGNEKLYEYNQYGQKTSMKSVNKQNIKQVLYSYNDKKQLVKESVLSAFNSEISEDVYYTYEYDENNNRSMRAFLPDGREFQDPDDAGFYMMRIRLLKSSGNENIQEALGSFKLK